MDNKKFAIKSEITGKVWESVKKGIPSPYEGIKNIEKLSDDELNDLHLKTEENHKGREVFEKTVRIMADALIRNIPTDYQGITVTLLVEEK